MANLTKQPLRMLENPFPFFAEATDAASRLFNAQRDYLMVTAELRAKREAMRAAFFFAALIFLNITVTLSLFWATMALHQSGMSAGIVAILSFVIFAAISGGCAFLGIRAGRTPAASPAKPHPKLAKAG